MKIYYGVYLTSLLVINYTCIYIILAEHKDKRQDADINSHVKYGAKGQIKRSYIINGQPLQKDFTPSWDSARLQRRRLALYPEWLSKRIRNFIGKHFPPRFFHAYANQRNSNSRDIIPEALGKETILKKFNNIKKNITPNKGNNYRRSFYIVPDSNSLHTGDNEDLNDGRDDGGISVPSSLSSLGAELVDIPSSFREVSPISLYDYTTDKGDLPGSLDDNDWINYDHDHDHDNNDVADDETDHHAKHHSMLHHPCHHHTCLNGGRCLYHRHHRKRYRCSCREGFRGHYCEVTSYSCHPNPCANNGICTKREQGYSCSCDTLYKGSNCKVKASCPSNPCRNGGTCLELENGFMCKCISSQYTGQSCENKISPCDSNPCKNGGSCKENGLSFQCTCVEGFSCDDCSCKSTLVTKTTTTVGCPANFCKNGGTCLVTQSGFSCQCAASFHGNDCAIPDTCNPNPCENGGICVQVGDDYKCVCAYGYKGTNCHYNLACVSHPCRNGGKCIEDDRGFHCICAKGYKGETCAELSPCSGNPCAHEAQCTEKGPLYTCVCKVGFKGIECNERDPCSPNPCQNSGICHLTGGIATCNCTSSWMGDFCEVKNECHPSKCQNGGTCVHNGGVFHCICTEPFHGSSCEKKNPCISNPCGGNGVCQVTEESFICVCNHGFSGKNCEVGGLCHPNPCHNEGACYEGDGAYICECPSGYAGKICEIQDFCDPNPCHNGGSCLEEVGTYSCNCPMGYMGKACETSVCLPNPCKNGGTCMPANTDHGYACECMFPFHGFDCAEVDPCLPNPCRNGGSCKSHLKEIKELHLHEAPIGSLVHGTDESVVTVVGPEESDEDSLDDDEGFHLPDKYDDHFHHISPHHFHEHGAHGTSYFGLEHGEVVDHGHLYEVEPGEDDHDHEETISYLTNVHSRPIRVHHYQESSADFDDDTDRHIDPPHHGSHLGIQDEVYGMNDENRHHSDSQPHTGRRRDKGMNRLNEDTVTKITKNVVKAVLEETKKEGFSKRSNVTKTKTNKIRKRTLQDLYVCECLPGFLGAHCQHANPCERTPCKNGGTCIPRGALYQCNCLHGYGGLNCDDLHPCDPNPCLHEGQCGLSHNVRGYHCDCAKGWKGYQCERVDNCADGNPCQHGGKCISTDIGVECRCRPRFGGNLCEVDKCSECNTNAYCKRGHCVCKPGFIGNGFKCKAIGDVCTPNPCENQGVCMPGQDGKIFVCHCKGGFTGSRCEYPNPCAAVPCRHNGVCVDSSNSKEKGIILVDHHDYKCFCPQGYRGKNCEETTLGACSSTPCLNNATCFDSSDEYHRKHLKHPDDYECYCKNGFSGKNCEIHHYACWSMPCQNGATCLDSGVLPEVSFDAHGYKCNCLPGFIGKNCEVTLGGPSPCHASPCLHGGRCVDITDNTDPEIHFEDPRDYKCFCEPQFSGKNCEVNYPACASSPCRHNGTCIDGTTHPDMNFDENGYHCLCHVGYEGKNCERQYAFATSDEEEATLHPTEQPDTEQYTPTPMVVFMRPSKTPPHFGTPKQAKPGIIIIKQHTTPKPSLDLSVQELAAEHRIGIHAFAKPTIVADGSGVSIQSDVDDHHTEPIIIRTGSHEVQNTHYPIDSSRPTVDVIAIKPDNNAAGGVSAVTDIAHHMPGIHKGQPIDQSMTTIVQIKPDTGASGGAVAIVDQTVRNPAHASQTLASIVPDKGAGGNFKTAPNVIDQNIVQTISQAASVNRHQSNTENQISDLTNNNNDMGQKDLSRLDQNAEATPIPLPPKRLTNPPSIPTEPVEIKEEPTKPLEPPKPGEPGYGPPGASIEETNNLEPPKPGEPGYGPPGTARDTDSYVTTGTTRSQGLGYARKSDIQQDWKETYNKLYRRRYGLSP